MSTDYLAIARRAGAEFRPRAPEPEAAAVIPFDLAQRVAAALAADGPGWIVIRSRALGGKLVLWTRDAGTVAPREASELPRYTLEELDRLIDSGATGFDLRVVHALKERFSSGATIECAGGPVAPSTTTNSSDIEQTTESPAPRTQAQAPGRNGDSE